MCLTKPFLFLSSTTILKSKNGKLRHQNADPKQLGAKQTAHFIVLKFILLGNVLQKKSKIPSLNQCTKFSFLAPLLNVNLPFYMGTDDFV